MQRFPLRPPAAMSPPSGPECVVEEPCADLPSDEQPSQADEHRHALFDGIDALTRMRFSAVLRGPGYLDTLRRMGLPDDFIDPSAAARLDERMGKRFLSAAGQRMSPVSARTVTGWLQNEVILLTH